MNLQRYMTVTEASDEFKLNRKTILAWIHQGKIEASNVTSNHKRATWRIATAELLRVFEEGKTDKENLKLIHSTKQEVL